MKSLVVAAAFAAVLASPTFAQSPAPGTHHKAQSSHHHRAAARGHEDSRRNPASAFGAVTPFGAARDNRMSASRASAIGECNDFANKQGYPEKDSNMRISEYRACMAQHGQPE